MKNVAALILAGGNIAGYGLLMQNRAKAALPFIGSYRIIDFALSSLRHSGVTQVGLIIQYLPSSLIEHVGVGEPWDLHGYGRTLKIMPPFVGVDRIAWYKGTADALYQNINFIYDTNPDDIIVASGEHVYRFDFRPLLEAHREKKADVTFVTRDIPPEKCLPRFGYVVSADNDRITRFVEKPEQPPNCTVSTGIYVFTRQAFMDVIGARETSEERNLARDVLPLVVEQLDCYAYPMLDEWEYLSDVGEYFDVQMAMTRGDNYRDLRNWGLITNFEYRGVGFAPAALYGEGANVSDAIVSSGCEVLGEVADSVLSPGVIVQRGAIVRNCILMNDCIVESGAQLEGVISDKDSFFGRNSRIGIERITGQQAPGLSKHIGELTLVGKAARISDGISIPKGSQVQHGSVVGPLPSITVAI
jgi:glucose-1-phosphate adenylyltransferase